MEMGKLVVSIVAGIILGTLIVLMPSLMFNMLFKGQVLKPAIGLSNVSSTTSGSSYSYLPTVTKMGSVTTTVASLTSPFLFKVGESASVNVYDKVFLIVIVSLIVALAVFLYAKRSME